MVKKEDGLTAKQRYFQKRYDEAPWVNCACGCGEKLKAVDKYARPASYVNGHNTRIRNDGKNQTNWEIQKRWRENNPDKVKATKARFNKRRKLKAIALKGGECVYCGLKHEGNNARVFEFHHLDPTVKEDNLSRMLVNRAWSAVVKELEQCVLTCANCHRLVHTDEDFFEGDDDDYESSTDDSGRGLGSDQNLDE